MPLANNWLGVTEMGVREPSHADLQQKNEMNFVSALLAVFVTVAAVGCKAVA